MLEIIIQKNNSLNLSTFGKYTIIFFNLPCLCQFFTTAFNMPQIPPSPQCPLCLPLRSSGYAHIKQFVSSISQS